MKVRSGEQGRTLFDIYDSVLLKSRALTWTSLQPVKILLFTLHKGIYSFWTLLMFYICQMQNVKWSYRVEIFVLLTDVSQALKTEPHRHLINIY